MAPMADNDDGHYDAGAPLDGGASPAVLAGSDKHFSPTGLEIGIITAVVVVVFFSLVGLFVWRSRKNRAARMADAGSPNATSIPIDEHLFHPVESQDSRDSREPVPPPKFEQAHGPQAQPVTPSPYPTRSRRGGKRDSVEEHEIAARF
ncbi:hypothetical protein F4820DRAFT_266415 [Hypoxylon rubiginosum]|uniref:Uncharacterized protein n=1 Tax=Hypoxylon rubiginosum TaxID=110542 RepID=A0ACB9Z5B9_9PEZI|nr:hypothetical protein F4820DRAFT_266415 [Hypoxylon rubiginosum]